MPIYEFYCRPCHTVFSFLSRRYGTTKPPPCPRCSGRLSREVSTFAFIGSNSTEDTADDPLAGIDETRMEEAMAALSGEMGMLEDEDSDPSEAARIFQKFAAMTGMKFKPELREALERLESGADPESVEAEFGELLEDGSPFEASGSATFRDLLQRLRNEPYRDPTLYDLKLLTAVTKCCTA